MLILSLSLRWKTQKCDFYSSKSSLPLETFLEYPLRHSQIFSGNPQLVLNKYWFCFFANVRLTFFQTSIISLPIEVCFLLRTRLSLPEDHKAVPGRGWVQSAGVLRCKDLRMLTCQEAWRAGPTQAAERWSAFQQFPIHGLFENSDIMFSPPQYISLFLALFNWKNSTVLSILQLRLKNSNHHPSTFSEALTSQSWSF